MTGYPLCRVGPYDITHVSHVHRSINEPHEGVPGAYATEQITFYRDGGGPPPKIKIPCEYDIIIDGEHVDTWDVCCEGRDNTPGGYVLIKRKVVDEQAQA